MDHAAPPGREARAAFALTFTNGGALIESMPIDPVVPMKPKRRFVRTLNSRVIAVAVSAMVLLGGISTYRDYAILQETLEQELTRVEEFKRQTLKERALEAKAFVDYLHGTVEDHRQADVRRRVGEAYDVADNIVKQFAATRSADELRAMVRESLRPIRWRDGRGYFFIVDTDGVNRLHPPNPAVEGIDLVRDAGAPDQEVGAKILKLIATAPEGFLRTHWPNPAADNAIQDKLIFVRLFEPLGWIIGTGEYLDDFENELKQTALDRLAAIRYDDGGYIFVGQWNGVTLGKKLGVQGKNMWDVVDANGIRIVQELVKGAKAGGGFVEYVMPEFGAPKMFRKISYAVGVPAWQWYLGVGTSMRDIETEIAARREAGLRRIAVSTAYTAAAIAALLAMFLALSNRMSIRFHSDYRKFAEFFRRAATDHAAIATDDMVFVEFAELAEAANRMTADREQAEQARRDSDARFRAMIDNMPADIQIKAPDGRYVLANRVFERNYGPIVGPDGAPLSARDLFPSDTADAVAALDRMVVATGGVVTEERLIPRRGGDAFDALIIKFPLLADDGSVSMIGTITMDISELKAAEGKSRELQNEIAHVARLATMGEMAASVSHELNQPLMAVSNYAAGCRRRLEAAGEDPLKLIPVLQRITDEANRAGEVIRAIRDFSRKREATRHPVRIADIVHDVVALTRNESRQAGAVVRLDLAPDLPTVSVDPVGIRQVLINLVRNAIEAGAADGRRNVITIASGVVDSMIEVGVRDTGTGMDEGAVAKVFEAFFTTKETGTGLGLSICRRIVEAHGGQIAVESVLGQGTEFRVRLPATA